jgi:hypothetical protein
LFLSRGPCRAASRESTTCGKIDAVGRSSRTIESEIAGVVGGGVPASVGRYVTKYLAILGVHGEPPVVRLRDNLGARWLGRSTWSPSRPDTTLLELQRSILGDDRTLERVVAHEVIHHRDALAMSEGEVALLRLGIKPESHDATFREGAARINAIMGTDFVTEASDQEYKQTRPRKEFVVLVTPLPDGRLGWTWAVRLGPKATDWANKLVERGSRLVRTTDERWTRGLKIERHGGYSVPRDDHEAALLRELYAS